MDKEEAEFQLKMLKTQIMHQDIWSAVTLFLAILFSTMMSLVTTYMTFYFTSGNQNWAFTIIGIIIVFPATMFLVLRYYSGPGARKIEKNVEGEIQKIREFIDKKPIEKT